MNTTFSVLILFSGGLDSGKRKSTNPLISIPNNKTNIKLDCQGKCIDKSPPIEGAKAGDKETKGINTANAL